MNRSDRAAAVAFVAVVAATILFMAASLWPAHATTPNGPLCPRPVAGSTAHPPCPPWPPLPAPAPPPKWHGKAQVLTPAAKPLGPCVQEDSPGPCVWDARHMGNGIGKSFLALPPSKGHNGGRVIYLSHTEAHRLLAWS